MAFDQQLKMHQENGKITDLYFNTSTELIDFYDFLLGLRIDLPDKQNHIVYRPLFQKTAPTGYSEIIDQNQTTDSEQTLSKLSVFGVETFFTISNIDGPDSQYQNWIDGLEWHNTIVNRLQIYKSDELANQFINCFSKKLLQYVYEWWNENHNKLSLDQVCSFYDLLKVTRKNEYPLLATDSSRRAIDSLELAVGLTIETGFINDNIQNLKAILEDFWIPKNF